MNTLLPQLNSDLGELADSVRRSLVQVSAGGRGSGSGLIFSADRRIVTNAHVVSGDRGRRISEFQITLPDGKTAAARMLAEDKDIDVAVLKIEQTGETLLELHPIEIGDSRKPPGGSMGDGHGLSVECPWRGGRWNRHRSRA